MGGGTTPLDYSFSELEMLMSEGFAETEEGIDKRAGKNI